LPLQHAHSSDSKENRETPNENLSSSQHSSDLKQEKQSRMKTKAETTTNKRRLLKHGLTVHDEPLPQLSNDYLKRELKDDVFCKISSHLGDVDNDPHTPKSSHSLMSAEKRRKVNNKAFALQLQSDEPSESEEARHSPR